MENIPVRGKILEISYHVYLKTICSSCLLPCANHSKIQCHKRQLIMLMDSVRQGFGQDTVRVACLCHMMSETSAGEIQMTEGQNHGEVFKLTFLRLGLGRLKGCAQLGLLAAFMEPLHVPWASLTMAILRQSNFLLATRTGVLTNKTAGAWTFVTQPQKLHRVTATVPY